MTLDEMKDKYKHLLTKRVRVDFKEFVPNVDYVIVLPFVLKQFDKRYNEQYMQFVGNKKPQWYISFFGYFTQDTKVQRPDETAPCWIRKHEIATLGFSGYGFFDNFEHCELKEVEDLGEEDGVEITFRRKFAVKDKKAVSRFWKITKVKTVKHNEYPEKVKQSGAR